VTDPSHPIFHGLTLTNGALQLFNQCNTNAVTAISTWTGTEGFDVLATPVSQAAYTTIADFPAGTNCNGTVLPQRMVMIGVSEYSTAYLTAQGKQLIENAIRYLLGMDFPEGIENLSSEITYQKYIQNGKLYIEARGVLYDATGRRVAR
jgi:hypothetical protein